VVLVTDHELGVAAAAGAVETALRHAVSTPNAET
jgi:hypothetical protein